MASLDRRWTTDFAWVPVSEERQAEEDRRTALNKLLVLAADVTDLGLRYRLVEAGKGRALLSVWEPSHQAPSETIGCAPFADGGWQFFTYPLGPVLGSAEDVEKPGDAKDAAKVVAERLGMQP